jgi:hypothetical protein
MPLSDRRHSRVVFGRKHNGTDESIVLHRSAAHKRNVVILLHHKRWGRQRRLKLVRIQKRLGCCRAHGERNCSGRRNQNDGADRIQHRTHIDPRPVERREGGARLAVPGCAVPPQDFLCIPPFFLLIRFFGPGNSAASPPAFASQVGCIPQRNRRRV